MKAPAVGSHHSLVREFISEARVPPGRQRGQVRELFRHKLSAHLSRLQSHQMREERFAQAHDLALQHHLDSAQRAQQLLQAKQLKAHQNKSHSLLERSRRAEEDLARWENVVDRNRQKYERELHEAKTVIRLWNEKLEESSLRRNSLLHGVSNELKAKLQAKQEKALSLRLKDEPGQNLNPERSPRPRRIERSPRESTRVSTEGLVQRRRGQEQAQNREWILRTVGKEERINQARYMRHYFQERRRKQQCDKEEILRAMRQHNLNALRDSQEQRTQLIENRLARERRQNHFQEERKGQHRGRQSLRAVFNNFGQEDSLPAASPNRNYSKLMTQKLQDITSVVRHQRTKH